MLAQPLAYTRAVGADVIPQETSSGVQTFVAFVCNKIVTERE